MVDNNSTVANKIMRVVAWLIWAIFVKNIIGYIAAPFIAESNPSEPIDTINLVIYGLLGATLVATGITFLIRHFAIMKPFKKGTYNPQNKFSRYLIVGIVAWFISNVITLYGTVVYFMSGIIWPHYIFSAVGAFLLLYHCPRLGPFNNNLASNSPESLTAATQPQE